eukprot:TRINITY_DN5864_c0_g1_i1.p1 TRINITY_DN5864_c0_g1~~TRINITY_DN5864_c0_g1_i1.p1  ORF type:complete len:328 (+),score=68.87 TRINITY_DN5864_c0_g1_i1:39-986(+)
MTGANTKESWRNKQQWSIAERLKRSSEGSAGVFILELKDGTRTVIKPCSEPALELFAGRFLEQLGLHVPGARLVEYSDREWEDLRSCCLRLGKLTNFPIKVEREMQRPFFIVMEYVEGIDLMSFRDYKTDEEVGLSPKQIEDLGILVAGDMFLNNWDRLPFVWKNGGNPYNILISSEDGSGVIAIDQKSTTLIDLGIERYVTSVEDFLKALAKDVGKETPQTAKARKDLMTPAGRELILFEQVPLLQRSIVNGLRKIGKMKLDDIEQLKLEIVGLAKHDWDNCWANAIEKIRIPFFARMLRLFAQYFPDDPHKSS